MTTSHAIYDDGILRITWTASPPAVALAGEIDETTYPALGKLDDLLDGHSEIFVNLADLTFCDIAGLRAIIGLTGADSHQDGRKLILQEVPRQLMRLLQILGWDTTPGLITGQRGLVSGQTA